ncbi:hypothetical protein EYR40_002462 [Pleurotus pulmonarius]|nr:hypothetical protein EYR40_002462 [Pleurotus pulmonarius]
MDDIDDGGGALSSDSPAVQGSRIEIGAFGLDRLQAGLAASRSSLGSLIRRLSSSSSSGRRAPTTGEVWQSGERSNGFRGEFDEGTIADGQTSALLDGYDDVPNGEIGSHPRVEGETHAHASIASGYARTPPSYSRSAVQSSPLRRAG